MALTIQAPTNGVLPINARINRRTEGGALCAVLLPSGVSVAAPTNGALTILGAVVLGSIVDGVFVQQFPS